MTSLRSPWLAAPFALALLPACQPGSGGALDPVVAPGVERQADESYEQAALVAVGPLTARVTGRWSSERAQSLRITYRNTGPTIARVRVGDLKLQHAIGDSGLRTALDATGVDLTDDRLDNNRSRMLYSIDEQITDSVVLDVPAGTTRVLVADFTSFSNDRTVAAGDRIVATVPVGARSVRVAFTAARPPLWPF